MWHCYNFVNSTYFRFNEDDEPVSFVEYRKDCIEALDRLGWPISERNILLLEDEIEKGKRYLRHSRAIRRAVKAKFEESPERPKSSMSSPSRSASSTPRTSHLSRRKSNLGESDASGHSSPSKHSSSASESEEEEKSKKGSDAEDRGRHHSDSSDEEEKQNKYKVDMPSSDNGSDLDIQDDDGEGDSDELEDDVGTKKMKNMSL